MSTARTTETNKVRNRILIALGVIIVIATYLYLIFWQPFVVNEELSGDDFVISTLSEQAGLIAILGYVIGALLIAIGSIHRLSTTTLAMIPVAIALNIAIGQIVSAIGLPVYMDSIGTVLVAALAGPAAGIVTGILTNVIWGLTLSPFALPFAVVQVVIGVMAGYAARYGMFRRFYLAPVAGAVTGIVAAAISAPISAFVFGGATGGGTAAIVGAFQAWGADLLTATLGQGLLSDPLDKAITFTIVVIILAALPARFLQRFPFVREYNVFGKKSPTLTPSSAAAAPRVDDAAATSDDTGPK